MKNWDSHFTFSTPGKIILALTMFMPFVASWVVQYGNIDVEALPLANLLTAEIPTRKASLPLLFIAVIPIALLIGALTPLKKRMGDAIAISVLLVELSMIFYIVAATYL